MPGHALRMPLNPDDPVLVRFMLDGFDYSIRRYGGNAQAVAGIADALMMRAVYRHREISADFLQRGSSRKLGNFAARPNPRGVKRVLRFGRQAVPAVHDISVQLAGNVLIKRAAEAYVEALAAVTNSEHGLARGKSMFHDGEVRVLAILVRLMRLIVARNVVQRGVDVGRPTGKNKSVQVRNLRSKLRLGQVEGNRNTFAIRLFDGSEVKLKLVGDVALFFLGGTPGDAKAGAT